MTSWRLERYGLDAEVIHKLGKVGIESAKDLMEASTFALMVQLDLGKSEVENIVEKVSGHLVMKKCQTALELLQSRVARFLFLPTGIPHLDSHMRGGLSVGCITEICGPPGTSPTQVQLA
jgi:hypothetical protein